MVGTGGARAREAVPRRRADLAHAEQELSDAEAMLLAWADFNQSLRTQYRSAPAGPYVPPTHINDYQSAVRLPSSGPILTTAPGGTRRAAMR